MSAILTRLMTDQYASATDFPELAAEATRRELTAKAAEWGARFSYDRRAKTAALIVPAREGAYSPTERAALLIAYVTLRIQSDAYRTVHQNEPMVRLTTEGQDAMRDARQFHLRAEQLNANYPNVFVRINEATGALNALVDGKFLEHAGDGSYKEGPLLGHAFEREKVEYLIEGELAGLFDGLKPELSKADALDELVLATIQQLPPGEARKPALLERVKHTWSRIKPALRRLQDRGLIKTAGSGPATYYFVPEVV